MKVLKFGGTSLGSPERLKKLWPIIETRPADKKIIVLSAVSGTTNALTEIAGLFGRGEKEMAFQKTHNLYNKYVQFIDAVFGDKHYKNKAKAKLDEVYAVIQNVAKDQFTTAKSKLILAQGELLSTTIFHNYLKECGVDSVLLSSLDFMKIDQNEEPDTAFIKKTLGEVLEKHSDNTLFIAQGYICKNHQNEVDNLKRGGSDYTASLIGATAQAEEIQIWTDIDGLHNSDPRFVDNTKPVKALSFEEAGELAYFGAKILHPQSVFPAKRFNVPVRLLDTNKPKSQGTLISAMGDSKEKIVALAAKDGITAIRIQSSRMLMAFGFLKKIFQVFEDYQTPIDMITTSEVTVSLSIDNTQYLTEIIHELEKLGAIEVQKDQSIICIVGDFDMENHLGHPAMVTDALKHIPVRMISYGGSEHNLSVLLPESYKKEALRSLHSRLF